GGKKVLRQMPTVWELARRSEEHLKGMVLPGTLFEEMGFNYIGPMDVHDVKALVSTLRNIRKLRGPQFLHVVTRKGKGYAPAEADPIKWHGPGPFDPVSGTIFKEKSAGPSYSQIFGQWLCDMAEADDLRVDRKSTRLNSSHQINSYAVFCLKKKKKIIGQENKYRDMNYTFRLVDSL